MTVLSLSPSFEWSLSLSLSPSLSLSLSLSLSFLSFSLVEAAVVRPCRVAGTRRLAADTLVDRRTDGRHCH